MKNSIIIILALAISACGNAPEVPETAEKQQTDLLVQLRPEQLQNAGIEIGPAERRAMRTLLRVSGIVDVPPQSLVSVSFPLGGYLKSTKLLPGMHVRKGETIAVLEDPQYIQLQQDYLTAQAKLQYAEAELTRQQELQSGQAGSVKVLEQARAEQKTLKIQQRALGEKLLLIGINPTALDENSLSRSVRVPAPIDGFVSAVNVNIGKYVAPTDVLFELVNPDDIHLNLKVFEKDVPSLRIGQRINAYTNDRPTDAHPGKIILISRNVGADRSVEAHCHFDRYDPKLFPGMYMKTEVEVLRQDALAVPESAVVRWENRHFVFAEKGGGAFEMVEVEAGTAAEGYIPITPVGKSDLEQTRLVLKNAYALLMKMKNAEEE
ncbi:MAG: efflux RND transporter periplasmic adaptor subunit [Lewinellaceae bacterium]|nr:efflux RND transporter periplasmic adaptor subunit [Lewinellaceae bacterium]